jgi:hypothetical protein
MRISPRAAGALGRVEFHKSFSKKDLRLSANASGRARLVVSPYFSSKMRARRASARKLRAP